jgi:hypothetical protein
MTSHQTALILFAIALGGVIAIASVTTVERIQTHRANNDKTVGTVGLAKPRR